VARELTHEELEKAAHNLERIDGYLVPRSGWTVPPAHLGTLASIRRSVAHLMMLLRSPAHAHPAPPEQARPVAPLDPDELDADQLQGFDSFLERLARWLEASGAVPPAAGAAELVARVHASLHATDHALRAISGEAAPAEQTRHDDPAAAPPAPAPPAGHGHAAATPASAAQPSHPTRTATTPIALPAPPAAEPVAAGPPTRPTAGRSAGPAANVDDVFANAPRAAAPVAPAPVEQIALTASDVDPMFRWVGSDEVELTPRARDRIEQLFAAQGITYFRYQLENFTSEVRRRIKTAPEGHVLVIKVRDIGGERKPFLSYMPAKMFKSD
jgi:hypothetical protein